MRRILENSILLHPLRFCFMKREPVCLMFRLPVLLLGLCKLFMVEAMTKVCSQWHLCLKILLKKHLHFCYSSSPTLSVFPVSVCMCEVQVKSNGFFNWNHFKYHFHFHCANIYFCLFYWCMLNRINISRTFVLERIDFWSTMLV